MSDQSSTLFPPKLPADEAFKQMEITAERLSAGKNTLALVCRKPIGAGELVLQRFRERLVGRIDNNYRTASVHPDPKTCFQARVRVEAYKLALKELDDMCEEALG